jgi:hypothetical protein
MVALLSELYICCKSQAVDELTDEKERIWKAKKHLEQWAGEYA